MPFDTIFLDAGGVLVWPNWTRVSEALRANGIVVDPPSLAAADPFVRRSLDVAELIAAAADQRRGWNYFELVLTKAGVTLSAAAESALVQRVGSLPARTVHVGDFYQIDVVGARAAGLTPILVDEANLYPDADCARIQSVAELAGLVGLLNQ